MKISKFIQILEINNDSVPNTINATTLIRANDLAKLLKELRLLEVDVDQCDEEYRRLSTELLA